MYPWIIFSFIIQNVYSIQIGRISNATLSLLSSPTPSMINGTREQCLCAMVSSPNITALNYFSNNTCQLFSNQSLINTNFTFSTNLNSSFYFLQLPIGVQSPNNTAGNFPLVGTTVYGNANGTAGSSLSMLNLPWGITINSDNSMLISDYRNYRLIRVLQNATIGTIVANIASRLYSRKALYDDLVLNLIFMSYNDCTIRKSYNGSFTNTVLFGGQCGSNATLFYIYASFCMDATGNFYIVDNYNHRVLYRPSNSTSSTVIAGVTNVMGNDSLHLNFPQDIAFNETQRLLYVADTSNHRIMRYVIGSPNGTVVAGGNGSGNARNQLNGPTGLCISKKTNTIYVADTNNHRIVRWFVGDSEGTIIAGSSNGTSGNSTFLLNKPFAVSLDKDEKYLYVSDSGNNRIQRFTLD